MSKVFKASQIRKAQLPFDFSPYEKVVDLATEGIRKVNSAKTAYAQSNPAITAQELASADGIFESVLGEIRRISENV